MVPSNTPPAARVENRGYQPLREGYQPSRALNSTPPQGGSGVPVPASAPTAATSPSTPVTASGSD
jgi:hypothetical protein